MKISILLTTFAMALATPALAAEPASEPAKECCCCDKDSDGKMACCKDKDSKPAGQHRGHGHFPSKHR
jgi:hypothetical protein